MSSSGSTWVVNHKGNQMKKTLLAAVLLSLAGAASALEVGVTAGAETSGSDRNFAGVTVGQKFGAVGVTGGFERSTVGAVDQNRWSLTGSYDVVKLGVATVAAKAGGVFIDNRGNLADGYAWQFGVGVSYPLTKQVALTGDYRYQVGQSRVSAFDGNAFYVGVKYAF